MQQQTPFRKDEAFIHIRMADCEFEASGSSQFVNNQTVLFYHNAEIANAGHRIRQTKEEDNA